MKKITETSKLNISLVETILSEEKCGKGMYWCNTNKECKPLPSGFNTPGQTIKPTEVGIGKPVAEGSCNHTKKGKSCSVHGTDQCPMSEEKDPKGPVKSYKSPEELAKKHRVSVEEIKKQLEIGTKVEFEHTTSKSSARITALQHLDEKPDYYTKLKKMETQKESNNCVPEQTLVDKILGEIQEASKSGDDSLHDWFAKSKSSDGKPGWVQLGGKYAGKPCAKQPGQTTKPKCGSSKMASEMSPEEEEKAATRKRREDPNPNRKGESINVKTESKIYESHKEIASGKKKDREGYMARTQLDTINKAVVSLKKNIKKGDTQLPAWVQSKITKSADYIDTAADYLDSDEMSEGKKDACYTKVKSRYSVWPSAYASGALVKCRKVGAANWGNSSKNEEIVHEGDFWHPDPEKDKKLGGPGPNQRAREDRAAKPKEDSKKLRPGESYMDYAKRKQRGESFVPGKLENLSPISLKVLEDLNLDEKCWSGYKKKGMKTMFGKRYPNCVKVEEASFEIGAGHNLAKKTAKIRNLATGTTNPNEKSAALKKLSGPSLPLADSFELKNNTNVTIEDLEGNTFVEVVDLIRPEPITGFKSQVKEATRLQADTGNIIAVILSWRGKTYSVRMFFPQVGMPNKNDITAEIQKIYPSALVLQYKVSSLQPGMPLIQVVNSKSKNYNMNEESAAWQRKEGKNPEGGLNKKGIASYRAQNPGSKLSMAVTTEPSKLKPGSKAANRRKSFCARMSGMPGPMKDEKGRPTRKALSLRKWNC